MEAIVSSDYRQRMKGAAPAVEGPLLNHALWGHDGGVAALRERRQSRRVCRAGDGAVVRRPALPPVDLDDGERLPDTAWPTRGGAGN
jgi:hypothetical protein